MNWKDWLYIPKSDKVAIVILTIAIFILLGVFVVVKISNSSDKTIDFRSHIPDNYKEWERSLYEEKEIEAAKFQERKERQISQFYQPKMKLGETIELNSADTIQLKTIPGIGSGFANRIVKYRNELGGYVKIEQLNEVWGMDTYLYSQIEPFLTLNPAHDSIYINLDDFQKLLAHPYLSYKQVKVIADIRERKGAIKSLKRLELLDEFKKKDIERLTFYVSLKPDIPD